MAWMYSKAGYKMLKQKKSTTIPLTLIVKTRFVRDWIVSHYADKILDFFKN